MSTTASDPAPTFQMPNMLDAYTFQTPEEELNEIALIPIMGSVHVADSHFALCAQHREALCNAAFTELKITADLWGTAVESRHLHVQSFSKPWTITVGTLKNSAAAVAAAANIFGPAGDVTHTTRVTYCNCNCNCITGLGL